MGTEIKLLQSAIEAIETRIPEDGEESDLTPINYSKLSNPIEVLRRDLVAYKSMFNLISPLKESNKHLVDSRNSMHKTCEDYCKRKNMNNQNNRESLENGFRECTLTMPDLSPTIGSMQEGLKKRVKLAKALKTPGYLEKLSEDDKRILSPENKIVEALKKKEDEIKQISKKWGDQLWAFIEVLEGIACRT